MDQVLGIDLGGTAMKVGRFDRSGTCLAMQTIATPQPPLPDRVLDTMAWGIEQVDPQGVTGAIGVGTPGPADAAGRVARIAINLDGWREVPVADWLEGRTGRSVVVANDANCAGWGEAWLGAGRRFETFVMVTLGTGVGGAIVLGRQLWTGRSGAAAELGLVTLNPDGPECQSGNRGSLEQYVSAQAIEKRTGLTAIEWGKRAQAGDRDALAFWQAYGRDLGAGLASSLYVLTPEAVVIGGGVSGSAEFFLPSVRSEIERRVMPTSREGLQVVVAELGNRAGMVGAARLALGR